MMDLLLAVLVFTAIVATIGALRADEDDALEWSDGPRRLPDPSPRDRYAVTGTLDRAPVPSWG